MRLNLILGAIEMIPAGGESVAPQTSHRSITDPAVSEELQRKGLLDSRYPAEVPIPRVGTEPPAPTGAASRRPPYEARDEKDQGTTDARWPSRRRKR